MQFQTKELRKGSSYIPSPKWISDEKASINPKNLNDNYCFADPIVAALHHKRKHIVDLLIITDNSNNWYYIVIKKMKRLIKGVTSSHHGDFFCRSCMHSYRTENALKKHERL